MADKSAADPVRSDRRRSPVDFPRQVAPLWSTRRVTKAELSQRVAAREPPPEAPRDSAATQAAEGEATVAGARPTDTGPPAAHTSDLFEMFADAESGSGRGARSRPSVRRLGGGLVTIDRIAPVDPMAAIQTDPEVPEHKRFCWNCSEPVGRVRAGGAVTGTCGRCRSPYNFRPGLRSGEVLADQYEVRGCLAHGGMGWIYLASDRNVSDRWVVLKGLQNPMDFEAHVVALAERQFLSEVDYPGIVKIYNFVKHAGGRDTPDGYIVMEYVGGRSLRTLLEERAPHRLGAAEALAYLMEVLPALDYLHSLGLAYNDLKPDNIMVTEDEVKLIDLGAVAAMESYGHIYGTPGYQAPEVLRTGPTVATDIYAVGQTLATLILTPDPTQRSTGGIASLSGQPLLRRYPFLERLLRRATDPDPLRRFPSAQQMYSQIAGVLRMVLAAETGTEYPQHSVEFTAMRDDFGIDTLISHIDGMVDGRARDPVLAASSVVAALPIPLIDSEDPSAELLATLQYGDPGHTLDALARIQDQITAGTVRAPESFGLEGGLVAARALLDQGEIAAAQARLRELASPYRADWRIDWFSGFAALREEKYAEAYRCFRAVHEVLPGEIAPALGLAAAAELTLRTSTDPDDRDRWCGTAMEYYRMVWRTNRGQVSAAFGLARCLAADGECLEAVGVLDQVPAGSRHDALARLTGSLLLVSRPVADITLDDLTEAAQRLASQAESPRIPQLRVVVAGAAWAWLRAGGDPGPTARFLGGPFSPRGLRLRLEESLRELARAAPHIWHRYRLVDLANQVRPRTRW